MSAGRIDPQRCGAVHEIDDEDDLTAPSGVADLDGEPHRFAPELDAEGVWTGAFVATPVVGGAARRVGMHVHDKREHAPECDAVAADIHAGWFEWPAHGEYQRFGDRAQFAVDVMLEPCPSLPIVQGNGSNLAGRMRLWFCGQVVGNFGESEWLAGPVDELVEMRDRIGALWDRSFDGMSDEGIFDRLDWLCFGAHRGVSLCGDWTKAEWEAVKRENAGKDWFRFFLVHGREFTDGWKLVVVQPSPTELLALFLVYPREDVQVCRFPVATFVRSVTTCAEWLDAREREWLP